MEVRVIYVIHHYEPDLLKVTLLRKRYRPWIEHTDSGLEITINTFPYSERPEDSLLSEDKKSQFS